LREIRGTLARRVLDSSRLYPDIRVPHTDAVVVLTTLATTDEAVKLIRALLDRRLIACGTVMPGARSLYRWESKVADETEVVVMLKTRSACVNGLEVAFKELHPYKVPELLVVDPSAVAAPYASWVRAVTQ
jgi:periplasmic divalent cation tolerance protein